MGCEACKDGHSVPFEFTMAFQPIVDAATGGAWGYEALVRGPDGQGAGWVLSQVTDETRYAFDQSCRVKAIELAARLFPEDGPGGERPRLSINFMPNAVYVPAACIRATLSAADRTGFPAERIMLEFTEGERMPDVPHVQGIIAEYKKRNLITAIDDFGAGFSGLGLLAEFRPDLIKIDMGLVRGLDADPGRQAIVRGILSTCRQMGIEVIAEGVETEAECAALSALGATLMQGYLFAKPEIEALPAFTVPVGAEAGAGAELRKTA